MCLMNFLKLGFRRRSFQLTQLGEKFFHRTRWLYQIHHFTCVRPLDPGMCYVMGTENGVTSLRHKFVIADLKQVFALKDIKNLVLLRMNVQGWTYFFFPCILENSKHTIGVFRGYFQLIRIDTPKQRSLVETGFSCFDNERLYRLFVIFGPVLSEFVDVPKAVATAAEATVAVAAVDTVKKFLRCITSSF